MAKPGDTIGPYTLVRKLGRGAFGVVWLAEKRTVLATTQVALKFPNDEDVDLDAVKQEAALWVRASGHPNVLTFMDADVYDGQVVIVSEYAPDGSLSRWLEAHGGRAPTVAAAVEMALGILAGLEHLHKRGIIHRDIKPDNILLQHETPRLADFGIARILKTTTKSTVATGTPAYMPPEAFDGQRNERTDIWSVGVIFYQLLSGRLPFPQTDMPSLLMAIVTREPEPLPASVPEALRHLVGRALEKKAEARFGSAAEMRRALLKARPDESASPIADLPTQRGDAASPAAASAPPAPGPKPEAQDAVLRYTQELERQAKEERKRRENEETLRKAEIRRKREQEQRPPEERPGVAAPHAPPRGMPVNLAQPFPPRRGSLPKKILWITLPLALAAILWLGIAYTINRRRASSGDSDTLTDPTPSFSTSAKESSTSSSDPKQSTPTPAPSRSSAVRLRLLYQGASAYSVAEGVEVTLQSSTQIFSQTTDSQGYITFQGVPCNEEVELNYRSDAVDRKLLRIKRSVDCGTSLNDLGIFSATYGERLGSTESDLDGQVLN